MNAPAVGPGSGDDADSYKTDEFGTQTDEKKWSFNVGISDKTWIFIVELLMNFIPGYGDLIGVLQSFRDLIMGDTFLDKAISFVMLPMDLRSFGGEKVATEIARKGATETAKKGLEAGSKGVIKGFLGRLDNVVGKVGEKVFYAGGGSGMKNAFKTLFWPVIVLKRKLFGSSVPKSLFAVIEKSVGKHTDKLMKKVRNTVSESAGDAFEVVTKDNMDQLAKEFASETADVAKRLTGELEVIKKKLIDDIDLDFKDSGIQTKLSGGFDSLEKDAKIKEIDLWIKNPEFIKDMAAQEAGLKVFKGDWDKLMNPPKKPKPPSESAILFKLATSKLGSNLIEFFSYFGKFIGSLLKTIKEIAESIAGFGYLFKSGLDDVPLNKFNFIDIFKESDSDRYIDDLVASGKLTKAEAVDLRSEVHDILKSKGEFNANVCTRPAGTIDDNIELTCEISQKAKDQKINQYTTNLIKKAQENIRMKKVMQEVNEEGNPKELGFYLSNDELKQFDIRDIDTWPDSLNNAQDITVITGGKPFAEVGEKEIAEIRVVIFSRITDDLMVDVRKYFSEDMIGKSGIEDHLVKIKSSYLATRGKKIEIPDSSGLIAEIDGAIRSIEATIPYIKSLPNLQAGLTDEALLNLIKQSTSILKSSDNSFDLAIFLQKKDLLDNVGESVGNEYLIFIGEAKGRSKLLDQLDKKISMIKYGDNGGLPLLGQDYIVKHGGITAHLKNLYGTYNGEKFVEIPADKVNNVKQIITSAHKEYVKALNAARLQRRIPFLNYNKDGLLSEHSRHKTGLFELKEENGKITYLEPSTGKTRIGGEIFPKDLDPKSLLIDFSPDKLVKNGKVMKVPDKINGITKKDWFIHDVQMSGTDKIFKNSNGDLIELTPDSTVGVQIVEVHGDDATVKAFNDGINNLGSNNPFTYPNLVAVDLNNPDTLKDLIDNNVITKDESGGYFIKATVTDANGDVQYGELKLTLPDGSEPLNDRWLKSALIHYFQDTSNPASDIIRMYSTISYNSGSTWKADLASMERIKGKNDINVFGCEHGYGVTFPR
ncbi:MAG: hypothetical protein OEZ01_11475, partial [Candidatus Heimdallarchaeota archaeon]|nr:hypothetical protein [Candidatus Heimdallarchaeota archaeon]